MPSQLTIALVTLAAAIIGAVGVIVAALIRRSTVRESRDRTDVETGTEDIKLQIVPAVAQIITAVKKLGHVTIYTLGGLIFFVFLSAIASDLAQKEQRSKTLYGRWESTADTNTAISITEHTLIYENKEARLTASLRYSLWKSSFTIKHKAFHFGFEPDGHLSISAADDVPSPLAPIAGRYRRAASYNSTQPPR